MVGDILPVEDGLGRSELLLPLSPSEMTGTAVTGWNENVVLLVLGFISLLGFIAMLRTVSGLLPSLMGCFWRWKENLNLEDSVKLARDRNAVFFLFVIPYVLVASYYRLWDASFLSGMTPNTVFAITLGVVLLYMGVRLGMHRLVRPARMSQKQYRAVTNCFRTFFISLTVVVLATVGVMSFFNPLPDTVHSVILWETVGVYAIYIIRKSQIFLSTCTFFSTFLYLCALEFLPAALTVVSAILF